MDAARLVRSDVVAAQDRIRGRVRQTPVLEVSPADLGAGGGQLWLKLEHLQKSGSFKARGAFNRILHAAELGELPAAGVIAASGGNAGLATARAARDLGVPAEIHVPATAPAVKVEALRELDAQVVLCPGQYADAFDAAIARQLETGALLVHAYDHPDVCAGQGTLALELEQQVATLDTLVVAVGGGGLLAGLVTAVAGTVRVVAVEPVGIPTLHDALAAGRPVDVDVSSIAADALGARRIGSIAFEAATRFGVQSVLVSDDAIVAARRVLWQQTRLLVEHAAAAPLAALVSGSYQAAPSERIGLVLCGGNTDPSTV